MLRSIFDGYNDVADCTGSIFIHLAAVGASQSLQNPAKFPDNSNLHV